MACGNQLRHDKVRIGGKDPDFTLSRYIFNIFFLIWGLIWHV